MTDPVAGSVVSGPVVVAANAADNVGVTSVQFLLDGLPLGLPDTLPPFQTVWDSTTATAGVHQLSALARDAAGNSTTATASAVTVNNSAPPPAAVTVDQLVTRQGRSSLVSPSLTTSGSGDWVFAFVAMDGPVAAASQQAAVTGGGLTWTLVKRSATQAGVSEIWSAKAAGALTGAVITAAPLRTGYDGLLTVVAFRGSAGPGVAGASGAATGAPDIYLPATGLGSWVWAVGNDWDGAVARTPVAGQTVRAQWIDTAVGDTFWVQATGAPNTLPGLVTIHDNAPTNHRWNYAAVEIKAAPGP
jgi:hypothetical protein